MLHERRHDEEGVALVFAMLVTLVIAGLVAVMMARSLTETRLTTSARDRETAIHVAEAGIDHVIVGTNGADDFVTTTPGGVPHEFTPALTSDLADQKAWAIQLASDDTQCAVVATPGGETCGIRPQKSGTELPWIFGVGFVPSRDDPEKTRVVKIQFDKGFFSPEKAILTQGDLDFRSTICGDAADVHTNGDVIVRGDTVSCADPDGNVTSTGTYDPGGTVGPDSGQVSRSQPIPQVRAETVYEREAANEAARDDASTSAYEGTWFDLCPDGLVRAPLLDASDELVRDSNGDVQPCAGPVLSSDSVNYVGWFFDATTGTWETTPRVILDGIYYVHHANAAVSGNLNGTTGVVNVTVVIDAEGDIVGQPDTGDCATRDGAASGNIQLTGVGGGAMNPYLQDLLFLADGDFVNAGNNSTQLNGVVLAHEQIKLGGTATYTGAVISEGACDSSNSPVPLHGNVATGNFLLTHNGDLAIPLDSLTRITAWNEL